MHADSPEGERSTRLSSHQNAPASDVSAWVLPATQFCPNQKLQRPADSNQESHPQSPFILLDNQLAASLHFYLTILRVLKHPPRCSSNSQGRALSLRVSRFIFDRQRNWTNTC
eukprot:gene10019-2193_t